jgi:hypothetical protein
VIVLLLEQVRLDLAHQPLEVRKATLASILRKSRKHLSDPRNKEGQSKP